MHKIKLILHNIQIECIIHEKNLHKNRFLTGKGITQFQGTLEKPVRLVVYYANSV